MLLIITYISFPWKWNEYKKTPVIRIFRTKGAIKRGVPRQWFTGAIIMKKFMCNEEHYNVIALFFRTVIRITVKYEYFMNKQ